MEKPSVIIEKIYTAPVSKVWKALTDKDEMHKWYFDLDKFEAVAGFEFRFNGGPDGRQYLHICEVTDVEFEKRLTYSWRYDGYEGISFVNFELFPENNKTRLRLTH